MIVLAVIPPLWRKVMDPRVVAHFDGDVRLANVQPGKLDKLHLLQKQLDYLHI